MKEEQKFKGAGLNALIQVLKERYGEAEYTKMVSRCSPDVKRYVNRKIYDNEWIPDSISAELTETADKTFEGGKDKLLRDMGYLIAHYNLSGIYKVFVKFSSIKSVLKRADLIWKKYYSHGEIKILKNEDRHFVFEVIDYEPYRSSCPGVLGWVDLFLELYKKKGTVTHPECKLKGDKRCVFDLHWE